VVLAMVLGVIGIGLVGWAAWSFVDDGGGGASPGAAPSKPSTTVKPPASPADLARYYEQKLHWRTCSNIECATLTVPLDYAEPDGKTIKLAAFRARATDRGHRVGQLVFNPGGPGAGTADFIAGGEAQFGQDLSRYYDLIGLDPRGVGDSDPVNCASTEQMDTFLAADPDPDTAAEVRRMVRLNRQFGEGCLARSGDLARHVSTVEAARDMDVLRAALGESQLDYFGASYGTFLGATYAELFPTHVRRMVLDGALDPALSPQQVAVQQAQGFQVALDSYIRSCIDAGDCPLGESLQEGRQRVSDLLARTDRQPLPTRSGRKLTEGLAYSGIGEAMYSKRLWNTLTLSLRLAIESGRGDGLLFLADQYSHRGPTSYTDNLLEAFSAVSCLDNDQFVTAGRVPGIVPEFEKAAPTFGRMFAYGFSLCSTWPVQSGVTPRALHAAGAPPIVVIGTTRDPATPYAWAKALASELDSGVLVSRDGDGHTGFNQGNSCVDGAVEKYLLSGVAPKDGLSC
jgi:pimeloyl-ACP methyl ester carboxylesterase